MQKCESGNVWSNFVSVKIIMPNMPVASNLNSSDLTKELLVILPTIKLFTVWVLLSLKVDISFLSFPLTLELPSHNGLR